MGNKLHPTRSKSIQSHLRTLSRKPGHQQRLGPFAAMLGYPLILLFAVFLLPLYLYMLLFNKVYFWLRNQPEIPRGPYYTFDRHKIAHLTAVDKLWCEYCEWANGTLQWTLRITSELERRYCPLKNGKVDGFKADKPWRDEFLDFDDSPDKLDRYYTTRYAHSLSSARGSARRHGRDAGSED